MTGPGRGGAWSPGAAGDRPDFDDGTRVIPKVPMPPPAGRLVPYGPRPRYGPPSQGRDSYGRPVYGAPPPGFGYAGSGGNYAGYPASYTQPRDPARGSTVRTTLGHLLLWVGLSVVSGLIIVDGVTDGEISMRWVRQTPWLHTVQWWLVLAGIVAAVSAAIAVRSAARLWGVPLILASPLLSLIVAKEAAFGSQSGWYVVMAVIAALVPAGWLVARGRSPAALAGVGVAVVLLLVTFSSYFANLPELTENLESAVDGAVAAAVLNLVGLWLVVIAVVIAVWVGHSVGRAVRGRPGPVRAAPAWPERPR